VPFGPSTTAHAYVLVDWDMGSGAS